MTVRTEGIHIPGSVDEFPVMHAAVQRAYGVIVDTDSPTLIEVKNLFIGIRNFG